MLLKVKLHDTQYQVAEDKHKYKVINAGRQWGKSLLSRFIVLQWATDKPGIYWIVSPTYRQGKQNHWNDLQKEVPPEWVAKKNEVDLSITLKNGSVIQLKGAENPDSLRGATIMGLVVDEIASIRNWDWLWSEVLSATILRHDAPVIFISTPKGFNAFYDLYQRGQSEDSIWKSWHFTSYDNTHLRKETIDEKKKELTEDTFYQEYMADFRKYTGLVYKEFQREIHVIEPFDIPDGWDVYRGFDFGSNNPTVCLFIAVDNDGNWFIVDEHYESTQTIDYHAGSINAKVLSKRVTASYGDPSGAQFITEFSQRGIYITPATKETSTAFNTWVRYKIEKVAEKLKIMPGHTVSSISSSDTWDGGMPSLFLFSTCTNTIREFETYRWKEKSVTQAQDLNEPDVPEKANDHAMDALSYFACSYKKMDESYDNINQGLRRKWTI